MGVLALSYDSDEKYMEMCDYLNANNGYWIKNDVWIGCDNAFKEAEICVKDRVKTWTIADFTTFKQVRLKNEMKYFILKKLKETELTAYGCCAHYLRAIRNIGNVTSNTRITSFLDNKTKGLTIDRDSLSDTLIRETHSQNLWCIPYKD